MAWRRLRVNIPATIVVRDDLLIEAIDNAVRLQLQNDPVFESVGEVEVTDDLGEATEYNVDGSRIDQVGIVPRTVQLGDVTVEVKPTNG